MSSELDHTVSIDESNEDQNDVFDADDETESEPTLQIKTKLRKKFCSNELEDDFTSDSERSEIVENWLRNCSSNKSRSMSIRKVRNPVSSSERFSHPQGSYEWDNSTEQPTFYNQEELESSELPIFSNQEELETLNVEEKSPKVSSEESEPFPDEISSKEESNQEEIQAGPSWGQYGPSWGQYGKMFSETLEAICMDL